jgi:hypothetical protein
MHGVISGVDIDHADLRTGLEQVDGDTPQPFIDFAGVNVRRCAVTLDETSRRGFSGNGQQRVLV